MKLPAGFVLDPVETAQPEPAALPNGFVLDAPPAITRGEAFVSGVGQGASFGFGDEISAAAASAPGILGRDDARRREIARRASQAAGVPLPDVPNPVSALAGGVRLLAETVAPGYFGNDGGRAYDAALKDERARISAAQAQYPGTTLAGNVIGGLAVPLGPINTARQATKSGAVLGGIYGLGTGEGASDRLAQGATGAAIGAGAGALIDRLLPRSQVSANVSPVAEAGERIGVAVPRGIASESPLVQAAAQKVQAVPLAGGPMIRANERLVEGLDEAAGRFTANLGGGQRFTSGEAAGSAIRDWIGPKSRAVLEKAYGSVDALVDPRVKTPITKTLGIANEIVAGREASFAAPSGAVAQVKRAIEQGDGLTYDGIKNLRTLIGEQIKSGRLPDGVDGAELKRIYGALSDDLRSSVANAGGERALAAFERANKLARGISARREELSKIVGTNADEPAEKVFDRLFALANDKARGNIELLAKARKAIGNEDWNEFASGVAARIGRGADGEFSPNRFVTDWGKIASDAKSILFDPVTKSGMDDIEAISRRMRDAARKAGNSSGTAQNVLPVAVLTAAFSGAVGAAKTAGTLTAGAVMSKFLASPPTVASAARWSRFYEAAVRKPTAGSLAALNVASRNLAGTASDKLGIKIAAEDFLQAIFGPRLSYGETEQKQQNQAN